MDSDTKFLGIGAVLFGGLMTFAIFSKAAGFMMWVVLFVALLVMASEQED